MPFNIEVNMTKTKTTKQQKINMKDFNIQTEASLGFQWIYVNGHYLTHSAGFFGDREDWMNYLYDLIIKTYDIDVFTYADMVYDELYDVLDMSEWYADNNYDNY